jgi:hypothetical protein
MNYWIPGGAEDFDILCMPRGSLVAPEISTEKWKRLHRDLEKDVWGGTAKFQYLLLDLAGDLALREVCRY